MKQSAITKEGTRILDNTRLLSLDIETYSSVDLTKAGAYAYASAPDFEILLLAYAFDDGPVEIVDMASGEEMPKEVLSAITDDTVIKAAFNANFERTCLSAHLKRPLPATSWRCTAVQAAMLGLPHHLAGVSRALNLKVQKMGAGKDLIRYFSMPCKPTKTNRGRTRNLPFHSPVKWETFQDYCKQDVEVERAIRIKLEKYPIPEKEQKLWILDQEINDRGIMVDKALVSNAIACNSAYQGELEKEARDLTGMENPNSAAQIKDWLREEEGIEAESLSKQNVAELLEEGSCSKVDDRSPGRSGNSSMADDSMAPDRTNNLSNGETLTDKAKRMLELRQDMAKTSIKKYEAIERALCPDGRVRGLLQFYGANRTGRWSSRLIQIHNLPQNKMRDLKTARELLQLGLFESIELLYDSVPEVLSQLIRTAFIPPKGHRFIVADFSAIEARVIAWLAGEEWVLDTFRSHGKLYEATASQMFGVPMERIVKGNPEYALRAKGKVATLACNYQGGVNALVALGALNAGLKEEELPSLVHAWREANSNIVQYWYTVEDAAKRAVIDKTCVSLDNVSFNTDNGVLFITLPSGRNLSYVRPKIEIDPRYNRECLTYEGIQQQSRKWGRQMTYGGRLVENITQATARDCLAEAMLLVASKGYKIVMHCHDEIVIEAPEGFGSCEDVCNIMGQSLPWAKGLPLSAEGFECEFYKKE